MAGKKVVIIGGGISGLVAGVYALQAGLKADIYEAHHVCGGMCARWIRKGIACVTAIHWMMGFQHGSALNSLWKNVGAISDDADFFKLDYISAIPDKKGGYYFLYSDTNRLFEELNRISPEDREAISDLVRAIEIYRKLPIPANKPEDLMQSMEKALVFAPYLRAERQVAFKDQSVADYVKVFKSSDIRQLLLSVLPDSGLKVRMLLIWLAAAANGDIAFPLAGFVDMIGKIEKKFLSLGGRLHIDSPVKGLMVEGNEVNGVLLGDDSIVKADYIISTVSPDVLLGDLLGNRYPDIYFDRRFKDKGFYAPGMTLVSLSGRMEEKYPHTLVLFKDSSVFKINHYSFGQDGSQKTQLIQVVLQDRTYEEWRDLKRQSVEKYKERKQKIARQAMLAIENVYPGMLGKMEIIDVATPLTFQHYCRSYKGAYLAFCPLLDLERRENHPGKISGLGNLFLAGQWVFQEGGLAMAAIAGKFAVQRICDKN